MSSFHTLRVSKIERNTPSSVTISLEIPSALKNNFQFRAGQYITFKKTINNQEVRRAYSICTSPDEDTFSVGVKQVENGLFSTYANKELKEGDTLEVMPPEGRFLYKVGSQNNIGLIAAGSGITPILSIAKHALAQDKKQNVVLLYGNQSEAETMFAREIKTLEAAYPKQFSVHYSFSKENIDGHLYGRIDAAAVNYVFQDKNQASKIDCFYVCGPEGLIETAKAALTDKGIAADKIQYELFTVTASEPATEVVVADGETQITILLDDEETTFNADRGKFILDAVLAEDLDAPYSCQGGVCSSCIAKVTEGKARMLKNQILTDKEVEEGFILTCQAVAETKSISIDFDDV